MHYAIIECHKWDDSLPVSEHPGAILVHASRLDAVVTDLCGRNPLGYESVREKLRRNGRVYAACRFSGGYIVERIAGK